MPNTILQGRQLPKPFDAEAAGRLVSLFASKSTPAAELAGSAQGRDLLGALGGHSPFLADLAAREPETLLKTVEQGPDETFGRLLRTLQTASPQAQRPQIGSLLRAVKRRAALVVAMADIAGAWDLERVTDALSDLAEASVDLACAHLLLTVTKHGEMSRRPDQNLNSAEAVCRGSGFIVLGLGKLGGRELNYSSDIDLMLLYDPASVAQSPEMAGTYYVRLARDLVKLMEERTAEGYVFRTDLRLRPDPAATPLAVAVGAAIAYYESLGQNWERAALIKARPVAGDRAAGERFLREIRPFIWRRHLDFAAMADIHAIKRQIHTHRAGKGAGDDIVIPGLDVKLGRGGIREIEFATQVLQLIWGGRDPDLRSPATLTALAGLGRAGKIEGADAAALSDAYVFLRTLEHRLQMVADRQTHRLPTDVPEMTRIASFMGYPDLPAFSEALLQHLRAVTTRFDRQFETAPSLSDEQTAGSLVFTGVEDDPETLQTLRGMGFRDPPSAAAMIRGWHHGRPRAMRSARARELLTEVMPALLRTVSAQGEPDQTLARLDRMLNQWSAGVQLLSLLQRNPALLDRLAGILGASPALADHLAGHAAAIDALLTGSLAPIGSAPSDQLMKAVGDARHFEEALDSARRFAFERKFEIDAAALEGELDVDAAGELRSNLADAALRALLPRIEADFAERYGTVEGGQLAILALGKVGGREMLPGSDVDLVILYEHPSEAAASHGALRSLTPGEYYVRLANRIVSTITAPGADGRLYDVDMRLRPSGNKGPLAARLSAFEAYHRNNSWTWERMALTRARPVAGPPGFQQQVMDSLHAILTRKSDAAAVLADAVAMRGRMLRDQPPKGDWDIKAMPGGLIEIEFIAQALQLANARATPSVLSTTTCEALERLGAAGALDAAEVSALKAADRAWRSIISLIRLTLGQKPVRNLPEPVAAALLRVAGAVLSAAPVDLPGLRSQMHEVAGTVRSIFERRIGPLGENGG